MGVLQTGGNWYHQYNQAASALLTCSMYHPGFPSMRINQLLKRLKTPAESSIWPAHITHDRSPRPIHLFPSLRNSPSCSGTSEPATPLPPLPKLPSIPTYHHLQAHLLPRFLDGAHELGHVGV